MPSNAPSSLGALAAAVQAIECQKLLGALPGDIAVGREVVIDAAYQKHFVTALRRNVRCRFDHELWQTDARVPAGLSLSEVATLAFGAGERRARLRVERRVFVARSGCRHCGIADPFACLAPHGVASADLVERACATCGRPTKADLTSLVESLDFMALPEAARQRSLSAIGLRPGDLFTLTGPSGGKHFEVGCPTPQFHDHLLSEGDHARGRRARS